MRNISLIIIFLIAAAGCKEVKPSLPGKALLLYPLKNELCTGGTAVSSSQSRILFKWKGSENTDNYELHIVGLEEAPVLTFITSKTEYDVSLPRNKAYSWYVNSTSTRTNATTKSEIWRFYSEGVASTSYTPFPAEVVSPLMGEILNSSGKVTLDWNSIDVDNDISNYNVYFGQNPNPDLLIENIKVSILHDVIVSPGKLYYWKIITQDSRGNKSESPVFQFRTN